MADVWPEILITHNSECPKTHKTQELPTGMTEQSQADTQHVLDLTTLRLHKLTLIDII